MRKLFDGRSFQWKPNCLWEVGIDLEFKEEYVWTGFLNGYYATHWREFEPTWSW